jgi:hypothetical protein
MVLALALSATAAAALIRSWSIGRRMMAYVVLTIVLLLTPQTNFDNYWIWWRPVFLPLLCAGWVVPRYAALVGQAQNFVPSR